MGGEDNKPDTGDKGYQPPSSDKPKPAGGYQPETNEGEDSANEPSPPTEE